MNERLALRRCKARYVARFAPPKMVGCVPSGTVTVAPGDVYWQPGPTIVHHHEDDQEPRYISAAQFLAGLRFKRSDAY